MVTPTFSEAFCGGAVDPAVVGFVLSQLPRGEAPVLWVQDWMSRKEAGHPYLAGIGAMMGFGRPLLMVDISRPADVLWAMEDGLRCKGLAAVIGEIWGDPAVLDFTATKRLAIRSEAARVPCWLIRRGGQANLSAARNRWRISSLHSAPNPDNPHAPGAPRWFVDLFRSRQSQVGQWIASYDPAAHRLDFASTLRDGTLATRDGAARKRAV